MSHLKILVLVIAMATSFVVAVSGAAADELTSESSPVTLSGTYESPAAGTFFITAGNTWCWEAFYDGTATTPTTSITLTPTYPEKRLDSGQNCTSLGFPATIHTNGCKYVFNIFGDTSTLGGMQISCPFGNEITVTALAAGTTKCTIHIPAQTLAANSVAYSTIGAGATREITLKLNAGPISYTHTKGTGLGACTAGSGIGGSLSDLLVLTASNDKGGSGHVGLFLSS